MRLSRIENRMKGTLDSGSVRAVLRVRTLAPYGFSETQTEIMDRLQTLREDGPITELDIDVWGATMGADRSDDSAVSPERQRVAEFEQWATDHDCTLRPAFDRRTSSSLLEQDTTPSRSSSCRSSVWEYTRSERFKQSIRMSTGGKSTQFTMASKRSNRCGNDLRTPPLTQSRRKKGYDP